MINKVQDDEADTNADAENYDEADANANDDVDDNWHWLDLVSAIRVWLNLDTG